MRPGTFVFSYLGDPRRRFAQPLGMSQDTVDLGDCKVVGFSAAPPPRKGTELGILASLFGQRLTVWVRPSQRLAGTSSMKNLFALIETAIREQVTASEMPACNLFWYRTGGVRRTCKKSLGPRFGLVISCISCGLKVFLDARCECQS